MTSFIVAKWSLTLHEGCVFFNRDRYTTYHVANKNRTKEQAQVPGNVIMITCTKMVSSGL